MSDFSQSNSLINKPPKTKAEYSRNIKKLKLKLASLQEEIEAVEKKMRAFSNASNDKMIAMKISKYCKQRKMTPEMLFRCADRARKNTVSKQVFKETLSGLGIKLTQHEMTRLEYLLDEDVSGQISFQEYNSYLTAFKIKAQFSTQDVLMKDILKKLDINPLIKEEETKKKRQLLNYEEFLKYCHRNMSNLKDKEIAGIFNHLQKNNLIDLDQFLDYIKKKDEERRKREQKNQNNKIVKKDTQIDESTLKGIIQMILKNRPKDSKPLFHSLEFSRIERTLNKNKGELLNLFKQIDKQKKGSFGFNQLIQFYIDKEKTGDLLYVYQLMGRKMYLEKEKPEDVICRYNGGPAYRKISLLDFKKFMLKQFAVLDPDAETVYRALSKKDDEVLVKSIIEAMKLDEGQKKITYVKPTLWKTFSTDFWKKNCMTILFNPFVALRFCLCISEELKDCGQNYWDDFQFGPTFEDPFGTQSLGLDVFSDNSVKWLSVESVGMKDFYADLSSEDYESSTACYHDIFPKTLTQLAKSGVLSLWSNEKVDYNIKKLEPRNLTHLFQGVYPLIFHAFAIYGIYVFRFYSREKWAYVIVDNKIPCNSDNQPLFSQSKSKTYSWISLIEKAYAKLKRNYKGLFQVNSISQYAHQLTRKLPIFHQIPRSFSSPEHKTQVWNKLLTLWDSRKQIEGTQQRLFALVTSPFSGNLNQNKVETGLKGNNLNLIMGLVEIKDERASNPHKSHRLVAVKADVLNEQTWNPNWNSGKETNKFDKFYAQIEEQLKNKGTKESVLKFKNVNIINYKLFRNIFDSVAAVRNFYFGEMVILRKIVEFQEKHICKYELSSKMKQGQPFKLMTTLNKIHGPEDSTIDYVLRDSKKAQVLGKCQTKSFEAFEFSIGSEVQSLQIKVGNWRQKQDYVYVLTFYIDTHQYHLRQLDRQQLFEELKPSAESFELELDEADEKERKYIYSKYFKQVERGRGCCC